MNHPHLIRKKYLLNLPQLAQYLRISKTMLVLIEAGKRSLQPTQLIKMEWLYQQAKKDMTVSKSIESFLVTEEDNKKIAFEMQVQAAKCYIKVRKLRVKLEEGLAQRQKALNQLLLIDRMTANRSEHISFDEGDEFWLGAMARNAQKKLKKHTISSLIIMESTIKTLENTRHSYLDMAQKFQV